MECAESRPLWQSSWLKKAYTSSHLYYANSFKFDFNAYLGLDLAFLTYLESNISRLGFTFA